MTPLRSRACVINSSFVSFRLSANTRRTLSRPLLRPTFRKNLVLCKSFTPSIYSFYSCCQVLIRIQPAGHRLNYYLAVKAREEFVTIALSYDHGTTLASATRWPNRLLLRMFAFPFFYSASGHSTPVLPAATSSSVSSHPASSRTFGFCWHHS